ncbi:hypothetical protein FJT64_023017 [Amphibalanus amphitrite]|uniref:Mab-21-like HhH/H2TH-like domain-containing protein n=1 Tax=Amphibalanus amphitrite TaxID=1232801 RepID=A0A6A4WJH9_AMPAM|nr:hypothetical protein FJT64_023017 [Amphibalanus amphitrite]
MAVPVGFPGSGLEDEEWRLSFSQHEYAVYRAMSWRQRRCLIALKYCRAACGGPASTVKSYYLKTALLWRWETAIADTWELSALYDTLLALLEFLQSAVSRGHLPCYFLVEINLLASRSPPELHQLSEGLRVMRQHLLSSLLAITSVWSRCDISHLGECCLSGEGPTEVASVAQQFALSASPQPLVRKPFDTLLAGLLGAQTGSAPVWSLLTPLFQVVRLSWLGPSLAAEAERQRQPATQRKQGCDSVASLSLPKEACGWVESMLLIAQHSGEAANAEGVDSWLLDDVEGWEQ